jgi:hypothetical protein
MLRKSPKIICKCYVGTLVAVEFPRAPNKDIPGRFVMEPWRDGDCLRNYGAKKEISSLVLFLKLNLRLKE